MQEEEIYTRIKSILVEQFEVDESAVTLDANLYEQLDIDSIDAVDLMVQLKELTDKKISPTVFRDVRTIRDIIDALMKL